MEIINIVLLLILIVLQFFDIKTTLVVLEQGGREINPLINFLMYKFGVKKVLYVSKILGILAWSGITYSCLNNKLISCALLVIIVIYLLVIRYNSNQTKPKWGDLYV